MNERIRFWLITLATLVAIGITASLGRWQLSRAAQKEAMHASIEARRQQPMLTGTALLGSTQADELVYRQITVRGRWLADKTVFLDNRVMNGQTGFYVMTPLQIEGDGHAVLVQRGWAPRNFSDRALLPKLDTPQGLVQLSGRLAHSPSSLLEMGPPGTGPIRQNLDLAQFSAEIRTPLATVVVLQTDEQSDGLLREWPPVNLGVEKNYGYAVQWFGLSALLAILYVWFQIVRRFIPRKQA